MATKKKPKKTKEPEIKGTPRSVFRKRRELLAEAVSNFFGS